MDTPICDFVNKYAESNALRMHMPGHKGKSSLGIEALDITEISGADSLYEASGIIAKSRENASVLFGCNTFYSTEGSSLCIRAMLRLICLYAASKGKKPRVIAPRNAHKSFLSAVALLDAEITWLENNGKESYLSYLFDSDELEKKLQSDYYTALFLTSPDYLGNTLDISGIASICHKYGVLCAVDSAHGAYLRFLPRSEFAIDLGADICCSSAHKTLPVLTGGAYLHISNSAPPLFSENACASLALFGTTSPSYIIMQSLDLANKYLDFSYPQALKSFIPKLNALKKELTDHGYALKGSEPLKLTLSAKEYGYTGTEISGILEQKGIICEFCDPDYTVFMLTPRITTEELERLRRALFEIPKKAPIDIPPPFISLPARALSPRQALLSPQITIPAELAIGRILATETVGCPPAVPIIAAGEVIDENAIECFKYYAVKEVSVVKQ